MTWIGIVRNGQIELPNGADLPEGTEVTIRVLPQIHRPPPSGSGLETTTQLKPDTEDAEPIDGYALNRALLKFAGIVTDLPADSSVNVDHYLYGAPKIE